MSAPSAARPFRCKSTGRTPMLHPPGSGTTARPRRAKSGPSTQKPARIRRTSSSLARTGAGSIVSSSKVEQTSFADTVGQTPSSSAVGQTSSSSAVGQTFSSADRSTGLPLPWQTRMSAPPVSPFSTVTRSPRQRSNRACVRTSANRGTRSNRTGSVARIAAAMIGNAAFFEPLTRTAPCRAVPPVMSKCGMEEAIDLYNARDCQMRGSRLPCSTAITMIRSASTV